MMSKKLDTRVKDMLEKHKRNEDNFWPASVGASKTSYKPSKEQMRTVLEFAIKNNCVVNPMGWNSALEDFNEFKHCVCDPARPTCPCEQAPQEIKDKGHCKCHLFWKDYATYIVSRSLGEGAGNGRK